MRTRRLRIDDLGDLMPIVRAHYAPRMVDDFVRSVRASQLRPDEVNFLVVEDHGRVVGVGGWQMSQLTHGMTTLSWINAGPKRKGVGSAVVDALLAEVRLLGRYVIITTTEPTWYARWGFSNLVAYCPEDQNVTEHIMLLDFGPSSY